MISAGDPIRISLPAALPLSLAELKAQTRVEFADEDPTMMGYLRASVELCEQYTAMAFITQTFSQTFSSFEGLALGRRPVQAVISVTYVDQTGVDQTLNSSSYRVSGINNDKLPASLWPSTGQLWPTTAEYPDAITITYRVGFGDDHNHIPELIRLAVRIAAATFYANREVLPELPRPSTALLNEWRLSSVA